MEGNGKLLGDASHPVLLVYPLGLLSTSVLFDLAYLFTGSPTWAIASFCMIAPACVGSALVAIFTLVEQFIVPPAIRDRSFRFIHGSINLLAMILFSVSWWLRQQLPETPSRTALVL